MVIYLGPTLPLASCGTIAKASEQLPSRDALAALQQTGFTYLPSHLGRLCALTALVSPLPRANLVHIGGFVSVALSLRSPAVAVNNRPALRCPDFPHDLSVAQPLLDLTISIMTEDKGYFKLMLSVSSRCYRFIPSARSIARLTCASANLFFSRYTCWNSIS